jgi:GntR family transcriptional regulator
MAFCHLVPVAAVVRGAPVTRPRYAVWAGAPRRLSESTLMQRYGVARETARKAVRVLVAEGLVYVVQGRGAYVAGRG